MIDQLIWFCRMFGILLSVYMFVPPFFFLVAKSVTIGVLAGKASWVKELESQERIKREQRR